MKKIESPKSENPERRSLLIIDDDKDWTDLLMVYFIKKYEVRVLNSACDAMDAVLQHPPAVILVDLIMPTIDGFGIIRRLKDSTEPAIPTILLTGWNTPEVKECAASVGCAAVLSKPIELNALDETISFVMNGSAFNRAAVIQ